MWGAEGYFLIVLESFVFEHSTHYKEYAVVLLSGTGERISVFYKYFCFNQNFLTYY